MRIFQHRYGSRRLDPAVEPYPVKALARLRELIEPGLRDDRKAWQLVNSATEGLPADLPVDALQEKLVNLLQSIEIESILGGSCGEYRAEIANFLDWIEKMRESGGKYTKLLGPGVIRIR